jgi:hypothetical protein
MIAYEKRLRLGGIDALKLTCDFFDDEDRLLDSILEIGRRLRGADIPYAMFDGVPLSIYGMSGMKCEIGILVRPKDLLRARKIVIGSGVKINFAVAGCYPGDGLAKPVVFPDPSGCSTQTDDISYIKLENLIELKLASGMSALAFISDLADVIDLIKARNLDESFADKLNPYVREKYLELCRGVKNAVHPFDQ